MSHRIAYINSRLDLGCVDDDDDDDDDCLPDHTVFVTLQLISSRSWRVHHSRSLQPH